RRSAPARRQGFLRAPRARQPIRSRRAARSGCRRPQAEQDRANPSRPPQGWSCFVALRLSVAYASFLSWRTATACSDLDPDKPSCHKRISYSRAKRCALLETLGPLSSGGPFSVGRTSIPPRPLLCRSAAEMEARGLTGCGAVLVHAHPSF